MHLERTALLTILLAIGALAFCCTGCVDSATRDNNRLKEEILSTHDQAMAQIERMFTLELRLQEGWPGREHVGAAEAIRALQEANRAMFVWMNQYQPLAVGMNTEQDNDYRRTQLDKIRAVQRVTNEALARAESLLADVPTTVLPTQAGSEGTPAARPAGIE